MVDVIGGTPILPYLAEQSLSKGVNEMPWCPKCRQFQEEDDLCSRCWVELVDRLEQVDEPKDEPGNQLKDEPEVLLINVGNETEANLIQSILKSHGIPSLRKYPGGGGYLKVYMGFSIQGIEIYVLESDYDKAKEILSCQLAHLEDESEFHNFEDEYETNLDSYDAESGLNNSDNNDHATKRSNVARVLLYFILIPTVLGLLITLGY